MSLGRKRADIKPGWAEAVVRTGLAVADRVRWENRESGACPHPKRAE
jgi:hypothetical protein